MIRLRDFVRDGHGTISILFAFSLLFLMAGAGLSVDASNLFKARAALQATADGAALAVSADIVTGKAQIADLAKTYLDANAPPASLVQIGAISAAYIASTKTVTVKVTGTASTSFMALLGISTVDLSASSKAKRGETGPLDLVLALDVTASMNEKIDGVTKIATLKTAATSLINTVMTTSNARVGIVPFANYVQIGRDYRGAGWLDADEDMATPYCAWSGGSFGTCQYEDYACTVDGVSGTCKRPVNCVWNTPVTPEWRCGVSYNNWGGCVVSRMADDEYLTTIANPESPRYVGRRSQSANTLPPKADAGGCSLMPITDLTSVKSTALQAFGWFYPIGETFIPDGLIWSWNMLTKEAPLSSARSYQEMADLGGKKALVLMTDGFNTRYAGKDGWHYPTGSDPELRAKADDATKEICSRIKADGIIIYTVAFGVSDSGIKTILQNCASSPSKFFEAANASALSASFSRIGSELQRVRLMQ